MRQVLTFSLLAALTIAAYSPAMNGPFLFDDAVTVETNREGMKGTPVKWPLVSNPRALTYFTYAAQKSVTGMEPWPLHAVNLLIHLAAGGVVWMLLRALNVGDAATFFGTGVFLLHPIQTESVAYITGRAEAMAGLFSLAAILAWVRWKKLLVSVAFLALGAWSKESAFCGAAVLLVLVVCEYGIGLKSVALLVASGGAAAFAVSRVLPAATEDNWLRYAAGESVVFWRYIGIVFWPVQSLDWDVSVPEVGVAHVAAIAALLVAAGVWCCSGNAARLGIALTVSVLIPGSMFPLPDMMAEHRMYLAMAGIAILAALAVETVLRKEIEWDTRFTTQRLIRATSTMTRN